MPTIEKLVEVQQQAEVVKRFHELFYFYQDGYTHRFTFWQGFGVQKCPFDLWVYQELIYMRRPTLIIETGTHVGGSALFFAHMLELAGIADGRVVTIDNMLRPELPKHQNIIYLTGDAVSEEIVNQVHEQIRPYDRIMVVLDSDHRHAHVLSELRQYAGLVSVGQYLVVEDTNLNGHPVLREFGPGPHEALQEWLPEHPEFMVDHGCEYFLVTYFPGGWLRRIYT